MLWLTNVNFGRSGMAKNRFVLDTSAVIFLAAKGSIIPSGLEDKLNEADIFVSVISEIELFSKPALPPDEEKNLRAFLADRIFVADITDSIKKETLALRRGIGLKIPDCIVAASAITLEAVLLTADKELLCLDWPGFRAQGVF